MHQFLSQCIKYSSIGPTNFHVPLRFNPLNKEIGWNWPWWVNLSYSRGSRRIHYHNENCLLVNQSASNPVKLVSSLGKETTTNLILGWQTQRVIDNLVTVPSHLHPNLMIAFRCLCAQLASGSEKIDLDSLELLLATEFFSKRRKNYSIIDEKPEIPEHFPGTVPDLPGPSSY